MPSRDWLPRIKSLAALGMTGGILRIASVIAALVVVVAFMLHRSGPNDAQLAVMRPAARQIAEAKEARGAATVAVERAKVSASAADREAKRALSRAAAARDRVGVKDIDEVTVRVTPDAVPLNVRVPTAVVDRMRLDSTAVATLGLLVRWKDTVIVAQDRRITADSLQLAATSKAFDALQEVKEPRCGRRCGILLGVSGMLAAAIAVEQVQRMFK